MYRVQRLNKRTGIKKTYNFYTENEACARGIEFHRNVYSSWVNRELKAGSYILTDDGFVCEILQVRYTKKGEIRLPTSVVKNVISKRPILAAFKVSGGIVESINNELSRYPKEIQNIVKRFLANGFNSIEAVNKVLGSTGSIEKDKRRVDKYFRREDLQEYLRMEAKEHFEQAGIKPSDILKKLDQAVDISLDEKNLPMTKELCAFLLDLSGEFQPAQNDPYGQIFLGGQHAHRIEPTKPIESLTAGKKNGNKVSNN